MRISKEICATKYSIFLFKAVRQMTFAGSLLEQTRLILRLSK